MPLTSLEEPLYNDVLDAIQYQIGSNAFDQLYDEESNKFNFEEMPEDY